MEARIIPPRPGWRTGRWLRSLAAVGSTDGVESDTPVIQTAVLEPTVNPGVNPAVNPSLLAEDLPRLPEDLTRVEAELQDSVRAEDPFLSQVASHLLGAGGKRLRPTLTLCCAYAVGGGVAGAGAVTGGCSVELVHLGSLYHDDVIDEATTRRGVPSVNARWSNIAAILAGDFLLARASQLAASLGADVAGLLASTIGELCRGQVLELQHLFDVERSEEGYYSAIEGKTAALFATACRIGGMVHDMPPETLDGLSAFGHHLGMCFQIVDDVLDLTSELDQLGKAGGQDLVEGVYTLPVIYELRTDPHLKELLGSPLDPEQLARARSIARSNGSVAAAIKVAGRHAEQAHDALAAAPGVDPVIADALRRLGEDLLRRTR